MATRYPKFNLLANRFLTRWEEYQQQLLSDCPKAAGTVHRAFDHSYKRPHIRFVAARALSGDWNLGTTQQEVADNFSRDRTTISDAVREGDMSCDLYIRLMNSPGVPEGDRSPSPRMLTWMAREGFIGAVNQLAELTTGKPEMAYGELEHELLCEVLLRDEAFCDAAANGATSVAADVVSQVCRDPERYILPVWLNGVARKQIESRKRRIESSPEMALRFLTELCEHWRKHVIACRYLVATDE